MTVASTINRKEFVGNGATVAFATSPMVFFDEGDLEVYVVTTATGVAVLKTITTHYTVSGGAGSTGTVTMVTAPASTETLVIVRTLDIVQATDLVNNDASDAEVLEDSLDKGTMVMQQLAASVSRAIRLPDSDATGGSVELPAASVRASKFPVFDANGVLQMSAGTGADAGLRVDLATGGAATGAALSAFLQSGTGAVAQTVQESLRERVSITQFDSVGDGVADDTDAVVNWLTEAMTSGRTAFAPKGTYLMDPFAVTAMTGDIHIVCDPGAIFKYRTAVATPLFSFAHTTRDVYGMSWLGGSIDNSGGDFGVSDQSNTCIELVRMRRFDIQRVKFQGEATYGAAATATTGTDCGITTVDCKKGVIAFNEFRGQGDAGVYVSGGSTDAAAQTDDGGEIKIIGNDFTQCDQMVTVKRAASRTVIVGNTGLSNRVGVTFLDSDSEASRAGQAAVVAFNTFKKTETRAVELKQIGEHVVVGNIIEDFGYQSDGTTISAIPYAIRILGASDCIVADNQIRNKEWAIHANHRGIDIDDVTLNSVTYTPSGNIVKGNQFDEVTSGIFENATVGVNHYLDNVFSSSVVTPFTIDNAGSMIRWPNSGKEWNAFANVGNVGGGADTLNSITLPAGVLNFNRTSALDGRRLRITAWGSTANNSNPKTIELVIGSTAVLTTALTVSQSGRFQITAELVRSGTDTQKVTAQLIQGGTTTLVDCETTSLTEDDGATMTIFLRGTVTDGGGGINNNDIIGNALSIELVN